MKKIYWIIGIVVIICFLGILYWSSIILPKKIIYVCDEIKLEALKCLERVELSNFQENIDCLFYNYSTYFNCTPNELEEILPKNKFDFYCMCPGGFCPKDKPIGDGEFKMFFNKEYLADKVKIECGRYQE